MTYSILYLTGPKAGTVMVSGITIEQAADKLNLGKEDVAWAIETFGRCDTVLDISDVVIADDADILELKEEGVS